MAVSANHPSMEGCSGNLRKTVTPETLA
ncbi:hypothetical protein FOXB_13568 [Fusarium oxysporum f. sp. conglutinans Fo5176]|uniref:Uncharacterized protein n=1 Tax=Fusarium oxysporum (strain Fo5176) TaxID=660025 RepID=F9G4I6_FUSOF|nr:hypothetical protein FOXB_13568 [Fusarium oxysporum f. sp. conglutinans Fo5176]